MGKEIWSVPTWYFFHGLAARINKDFYEKNYMSVWINIYQNICMNLPCPMCKKHATIYKKKSKVSDIETKEKLITYLFDFHNYVNGKIGKPIYKKKDLEKYNYLKLKKCYYLVNRSFNFGYSGQMFAWQRRKGIKKTTEYLQLVWNNVK